MVNNSHYLCWYLKALSNVLGGCERLLKTPIYTSYTNHLSRFLFMWCSALPLAMYPLVGPTGTVPVCAVLSYFMLGIEDVGVRTEQPFDVLPLWQVLGAIDASCEQIKSHQSAWRVMMWRDWVGQLNWPGPRKFIGYTILNMYCQMLAIKLNNYNKFYIYISACVAGNRVYEEIKLKRCSSKFVRLYE